MSLEEFNAKLDEAMKVAVAEDVALDAVDAALDERKDRLERIRVLEGDA